LRHHDQRRVDDEAAATRHEARALHEVVGRVLVAPDSQRLRQEPSAGAVGTRPRRLALGDRLLEQRALLARDAQCLGQRQRARLGRGQLGAEQERDEAENRQEESHPKLASKRADPRASRPGLVRV
jgi:hypothetical protein